MRLHSPTSATPQQTTATLLSACPLADSQLGTLVAVIQSPGTRGVHNVYPQFTRVDETDFKIYLQ